MLISLTDRAKEVAKQLVAAWDSHVLDQYFVVHFGTPGVLPGQNTAYLEYSLGNLGHNCPNIPPAVLYELSLAGLIHHREIISSAKFGGQRMLEVIMLQALRDAVLEDFK